MLKSGILDFVTFVAKRVLIILKSLYFPKEHSCVISGKLVQPILRKQPYQ